MRNFGCHISISNGIRESFKFAFSVLRVNSIQIHPSSPVSWNVREFQDDDVEEIKSAFQSSGLEKLFFHGIYLINLASENKRINHLSKVSLINYLNLAYRVGSEGVVFHIGSLGNLEESEGLKRVIDSVNYILENSAGGDLILEVSAGSGKIFGGKFSDLSNVRNEVKNPERIKFGLDTQHMWASGYDIKNSLENVMEDCEKTLGFENVSVIHINDSKSDLGSKIDRHENLGGGKIGLEVLKKFCNYPKIVENNIPLILETPNVGKLDLISNEVKIFYSLIT